MDKKILFLLLSVVIVLAVFLYPRVQTGSSEPEKTRSLELGQDGIESGDEEQGIGELEGQSEMQDASKKSDLDEFQITACNAANSTGNCDTKLRKLDIVRWEECCKELELCCK